MNAASREPQSRVIAALTVAEVVSGPGVSSQGSRGRSLMSYRLTWRQPKIMKPENMLQGTSRSPSAAPGARGIEAEHAVDEAGEAGNEGGHGWISSG